MDSCIVARYIVLRTMARKNLTDRDTKTTLIRLQLVVRQMINDREMANEGAVRVGDAHAFGQFLRAHDRDFRNVVWSVFRSTPPTHSVS